MTNPQKPMTRTVALDYPVEVEGKTYAELTFRRMKAGDMLVAEAETSEIRSGFLLFATLAGVDVAVIEDLDQADLTRIGAELSDFLGVDLNGRKKAPPPSAGAT